MWICSIISRHWYFCLARQIIHISSILVDSRDSVSDNSSSLVEIFVSPFAQTFSHPDKHVIICLALFPAGPAKSCRSYAIRKLARSVDLTSSLSEATRHGDAHRAALVPENFNVDNCTFRGSSARRKYAGKLAKHRVLAFYRRHHLPGQLDAIACRTCENDMTSRDTRAHTEHTHSEDDGDT